MSARRIERLDRATVDAEDGARDSGPQVVLIYDGFYPERIGGIERRNLDLAREIVLAGSAATIAAPSDRREEANDDVPHLRLGRTSELYSTQGRRRVAAGLRYARMVSRMDLGPYDVVETASVPFLHLPGLRRHCRRQGKALVVSWYECWHGYWRRYLGPLHGALGAMIERWSARSCGDVLLASSRLTESRLLQITTRPIELLPVGLPLARVRAAASAPDRRPVPMLYAGRLIPEKRVGLLLRAVARMKTTEPRALLRIVGEGSDEARLRRLAAELEIEDRVEWVGRLEGEESIWRALGAARVAVQPSQREGFGIFPLEALAAGLPVVCVESPENAAVELVTDGRTGRIVANDPECLAVALDELVGDPSLRERMSSAAVESADRFDASVIAKRFLGIASRLAAPQGS